MGMAGKVIGAVIGIVAGAFIAAAVGVGGYVALVVSGLGAVLGIKYIGNRIPA